MATQLPTDSGSSRACAIDSVAQVYESGGELVVLVRLNDGLLELRVPRQAVSKHDGLDDRELFDRPRLPLRPASRRGERTPVGLGMD